MTTLAWVIIVLVMLVSGGALMWLYLIKLRKPEVVQNAKNDVEDSKEKDKDREETKKELRDQIEKNKKLQEEIRKILDD